MSLTDRKNDPSEICYEANTIQKHETYIFEQPLGTSTFSCNKNSRNEVGLRTEIESKLRGIDDRDDYFIRGENDISMDKYSNNNDYCGNHKLDLTYTRTGHDNRGQVFDRFIKMPFESNAQRLQRDSSLHLNSRDMARTEYEEKQNS